VRKATGSVALKEDRRAINANVMRLADRSPRSRGPEPALLPRMAHAGFEVGSTTSGVRQEAIPRRTRDGQSIVYLEGGCLEVEADTGADADVVEIIDVSAEDADVIHPHVAAACVDLEVIGDIVNETREGLRRENPIVVTH
jgi:hypothetical protein